MARVRLPQGPHEVKFDLSMNPNHVRMAQLLSRCFFGRAAAISRVTGIPERVLQRYMEPNSSSESPPERTIRLLRGALEVGAERFNAYAIAGEICRCLGGYFAPLPTAEIDNGGIVEEMAGAALRFGELTEVTIKSGVSKESLPLIERKLNELEEHLVRCRRYLKKETAEEAMRFRVGK